MYLVVVLSDGGGRGRPRSDRRALVPPVGELLFDGDESVEQDPVKILKTSKPHHDAGGRKRYPKD